MTETINVVIMDFPNTKVREAVTPNDDGSYTIFINAKCSDKMQRNAYKHALWHIKNHDFEKSDVNEIEYEAHKHDKEERGGFRP